MTETSSKSSILLPSKLICLCGFMAENDPAIMMMQMKNIKNGKELSILFIFDNLTTPNVKKLD